MITVVGIGVHKGDITKRGRDAIKAARYVIARSKTGLLGLKADETLDEIYKNSGDFDQFNAAAAQRIISLSAEFGDVVYLIRGDGLSDPTAELLSQLAHINIITGVSAARPASTSCVLLASFDLCLAPMLDNLPLFVTSIDSALTAGEVKLFLLKSLDADTKILFFDKAGSREIVLEDMDRQGKYDAECAIFVPASHSFDKKIYTLGDLDRIMRRLSGVDGCPWDREQTHQSIRENMIEEAYEAVRAIDTDDTENLIEELGDVLLQSIFHADIARRAGEFELCDVVTTLCRKLFTRHTHIFGGVTAADSSQALESWQKAKAAEKMAKGAEVSDEFQGFPSLLRAQKIAKKLRKNTGLNAAEQVADLLEQGNNVQFGQLLFAIAALAEAQNLSAEVELTKYLTLLPKNQ